MRCYFICFVLLAVRSVVAMKQSDPMIMTLEDPLGNKKLLSDEMLSNVDLESKKKILKRALKQHGVMTTSRCGKEQKRVIPAALGKLLSSYLEVEVQIKHDKREKEERLAAHCGVAFECWGILCSLEMISKLLLKPLKKLKQLVLNCDCYDNHFEDV